MSSVRSQGPLPQAVSVPLPMGPQNPRIMDEVEDCLNRYQTPSGFCDTLKWLVFRLGNAVKAAFSCFGCCSSDWQKLKKKCVAELTFQIQGFGNIPRLSDAATEHLEAVVDCVLRNTLIFKNNEKPDPEKAIQIVTDLLVETIPTYDGFLQAMPKNFLQTVAANIARHPLLPYGMAQQIQQIAPLLPYVGTVFEIANRNIALLPQASDIALKALRIQKQGGQLDLLGKDPAVHKFAAGCLNLMKDPAVLKFAAAVAPMLPLLIAHNFQNHPQAQMVGGLLQNPAAIAQALGGLSQGNPAALMGLFGGLALGGGGQGRAAMAQMPGGFSQSGQSQSSRAPFGQGRPSHLHMPSSHPMAQPSYTMDQASYMVSDSLPTGVDVEPTY